MTRSMTLTRAALRAALPALGTALTGFALLVDACPAQAFTPTSKSGGEATSLNLAPASTGSHASSGGASIVRTIVGLLIVIAVIWGLTWVLKQVKSGREARSAGSGLASMATLALGSGRTLHLVRAGHDYLLVGSAEHGVAPIHRYTEQQAREAGLLGSEEAQGRRRPRLALPVSSTASDTASPRATLESEERQTDPMRMPSSSASAVERLREWTVRR
jgi:flagellar protein FliO/FliZ